MSEVYQIPGLFLTALCHVVVIYHLLEHRCAKEKFILYSFLYTASFVCMGGYAYAVRGKSALITYAGIAVCLFLFFCIVSQECFPKKCFLFLTYFGLFSIVDNSMRLIVDLLAPQLSAPARYYLANVLRTVALLLLLALYKRYAALVIRSLKDIKKSRWWNLALIALLFWLLQAAISILDVRNVMQDGELFLVFAAVSLVMCVVYGVVFSNIAYMKKDNEAALIRRNAEELSGRLAVLQSADETNRRLRHDIRHHIDAIAEYAKAGDTSAILAYIGEYGKEISESSVKQYSMNRTIDSILSVYAGKAEENGIDFSVRCNAAMELEMREIDIIALMGNLLENALHGCLESGKEHKSIEIHIRLQNNRLIILCNNTCSDRLELSGSLPTGRSIGISSILSVCQKYNGNLDYKIENESCSACAVLNFL